MAIDNDDLISVLNGLIETCKDGQEGFKQAAEGVNDSSIKTLFDQYALQRSKFVGELQEHVRHLGGDPEKSGSVAGALHRGWINIKSMVANQNKHEILEECERGEDSAVKNYKEALAQNLSEPLRATIETQYASIREAHDRIRSLRDATNTATA